MRAPDSHTELKHTIRRLQNARQSKHEIINAIEDGLIFFKPNLTIKIINASATRLLRLPEHTQDLTQGDKLFKNKKSTLSFDLYEWLQALIDNCDKTSAQLTVWKSDPVTLETQPLRLTGKRLCGKKGKLKNLLLSITDQSFQQEADQQKRLMQAAFNNFNGQFIANEKGYILEANQAFTEMTGIPLKRIKQFTLVEWLEKQVILETEVNDILLALLNQHFWSGEIALQAGNDQTMHALLTLSMVVDADTNIEHYTASLQDITEIKKTRDQLNKVTFYDNLTGLANRKLALEHIKASLKNHQRYQTYSSLLHINLERFKSINDAFGRKTGDRLLSLTAQTLQSLLRTGDTVARVGGDEFIVITQDRAKNREEATRHALNAAHKISNALNQHYHVDELILHSHTRIGLIVYPDRDSSAEQLLLNADLASTHAKKVKNNHKIFIYEPSLSEEIIERRKIEADLHNPDIFKQLILNFQAQIGQGEMLHGAETLIRWQHPTLGFIPPDKFIPIAEESRQILQIGRWIMVQAFKQVSLWAKQHPNFKLSINISPIQFHEAGFVQQVKDILNQTGASPCNITLELTEGVLISDAALSLEKIGQLDRMGFKVSIDDFGTGYSSLSYLQKLPIHELKIDKSFIFRLPGSKADADIVKTIIQLALSKELIIVAEGVETQAQADFLRSLPSDILIQGYLYSRPCEASAFEAAFLPCTPPSA